ncbi:hypothetical protein BJV78DRAFT_1201980, partial [Lactifluus subvellereus]
YLRALRHERDDALRDLNASKDQTRVWVAEVDKWKALIVVTNFQLTHEFDAERSPS